MLIQPPIDKLIEKSDCKYALCCLVTKRARFIMDKMPAVLEEGAIKPLSYAAQEIFDGKIIGIEEV
jgi:DNA-directed RNA polymerase omega subunit